MLDIKEITYPITFVSAGVGEFTFTSKTECTDPHGIKCAGNISHFIKQHNIWNPDNDDERDYHFYHVKFGGKCAVASGTIHIGDAVMRTGATETTSGICKIEQMPIGAKLIGAQKESGEWVGLDVKPVRIEVDDETITFLLHQPFRKGEFAGEVSMKRGTVIKWSE